MSDAVPQQPCSTATRSSVDRCRVIRRSVRCFAYGLIGAIPWVGLGLAYQALRLSSKVSLETGADWHRPKLRWHWMIGLLCLWGYDYFLGWPGFLSIFGIMLWLQTNQVRRSFPIEDGHHWNPAGQHVRWGVALAYAGYFGSMSLLLLIVLRVARFLSDG